MQLLRLGAFSDTCYSTRRRLFCGCLILLMLLVPVVSSQAQTDSVKVPKRDYFLSFGFLYDGDFERGARAFRSAARSGIRSTEGRWIDSICYATMMGECMYRMGRLIIPLGIPRRVQKIASVSVPLVAEIASCCKLIFNLFATSSMRLITSGWLQFP